MTQEQIQSKLKEKMPQLEALLSNMSSGYKIVQTTKGIFTISKGGFPIELTVDQMKGLETYLNLLTIFPANEWTEEAKKASGRNTSST